MGKESPSWMMVVYVVVSRVMERVTSGAAFFARSAAMGVDCNDSESSLFLSFPVPFFRTVLLYLCVGVGRLAANLRSGAGDIGRKECGGALTLQRHFQKFYGASILKLWYMNRNYEAIMSPRKRRHSLNMVDWSLVYNAYIVMWPVGSKQSASCMFAGNHAGATISLKFLGTIYPASLWHKQKICRFIFVRTNAVLRCLDFRGRA